ncbi:MAG: hypothetical protein ABJH68_08675 [Ilumatobacter sp.]|uniref:DUF7010 family protein n=1 Tax=Ilumatobacter sp. TaxID=1967498 RepID=UPI00329A0ECE
MRIPFIPKVDDLAESGVDRGLWTYIEDSRGGSAFLFAGAIFWFAVSATALLGDDEWVNVLLYGGVFVPVVGWAIARSQGARLFSDVRYASLAALAVATELAALPVMFLLRDTRPGVLVAILMIADGAHLLIFMWLHLDYWYFLAANTKIVLGVTFLFGALVEDSPAAQATSSGVVSLVVAPLIWRDSRRTSTLYHRR